MTANSTDPLIGRLLDGRYQIRARIARGGMATVYLATDQRLERRVAIKVMHGHLADDRQFTERFIQEARSAARLAHPNVVNVFDQGQDDDMAYLVMEYLPGITLRDLLQDHGVLTTEQTIDVMEAVLGGLAAAHKAGIVHRDLKPENVLLADDGRIKISDFGLARAASANTGTGKALLGTIAYLSPELLTRGVADARSDIYALGIMMFEMLTGEQPYTGEQPMQIAFQHANDTVPAPSTKNPVVPEELDDLVVWATEKEPDDRPLDARAMLDRLLQAAAALRSSGELEAPATQRTVILPSASAPAVTAATAVFPRGTTAETQVLGGLIPTSTDTAETPVQRPADQLAENGRRRRNRGWVIALVVLLLVALAGGLGYWFGFGPGSSSGLDSVEGQSVEAATAQIQEQGFTVAEERGTTTHPTIAPDLVVETDPPAGTGLAPGSTVTLIVSTGPAIIGLPELIGQSETDATRQIEESFTLGDVARQFDAEVPEGTVLDAFGPDGGSLAGVTEYPERQGIALLVSAGPLPEVYGSTVDDATASLTDAGLQIGAISADEYSADVAEGDVLRAQHPEGNAIRVGDTVDLITSLGPEPVEVPDVVGMTWDEAKAILQNAGFQLSYNPFADTPVVSGTISVSSVSPGAGEVVAAGSTLSVSFSF